MDERTAKAIGARIRVLRKMADLTQAVLGAKLGVTQSMVCQWERGRKLPSRSMQFRIADHLGTERSMLFREAVEQDGKAVA